MRILIQYVLPILLPTFLWVVWLVWRQRRASATGAPPPGWDKVPWSWLLIARCLLALLVAVGGALVSGYSKGQYQPAYVDDHGQLVPGRFDDRNAGGR